MKCVNALALLKGGRCIGIVIDLFVSLGPIYGKSATFFWGVFNPPTLNLFNDPWNLIQPIKMFSYADHAERRICLNNCKNILTIAIL